MALTKAQARTVIRSLLDDEARQRWGDAVLDVLTQLSIDQLWGRLMDEVPWYGSYVEDVVADSTGLVDLTTAGSLTKRFGKMQKVTKDSTEYFPTHPKDVVLMDNAQVYAPDRSYAMMGSKLFCFPLDSGCTYELRYSFLPTAYTELLDSDTVEWPDGFEFAFIYKAAMNAMVKGEKATLEIYQRMAEDAFGDMKGALKRQYVGAGTIRDLDDAMDHGGT